MSDPKIADNKLKWAGGLVQLIRSRLVRRDRFPVAPANLQRQPVGLLKV